MIEIPDISSCGLTQEDLLKAHSILTADLSTKKTPYQLDLEVMGRKPGVIPEIGDKVKIKSREWYEKWKDLTNSVPVRYDFTQFMKEHCGKTLTIKNKRKSSDHWLFIVEETQSFNWSLEMFEEVYPKGTLLEVPENHLESTYKRQCDLIQERIGEKEFELQTIKRHRFIKLEKL